MKPLNSKVITGSLMALALVGNILLPTFASAQTLTATTRKNDFCAKLVNFSDKSEEKAAENQIKLDTKRAESAEKIAAHRAEQDKKNAEKRAKADDAQVKQYEKLSKKATTDEQKQAIAAFQEKVSQAVTARRNAFDAAHAAFRTGMDSTTSTRRTQMDAALATYKAAVTTAKTKAQTDCDQGKDTKTIKTELNAALKAAREKFALDRKNIDKISDAVKKLTETRKTTIEKAMTDFHTAIKTAGEELKAKLGKK